MRIDADAVIAAVEANDSTGFCTACGGGANGIEPDARDCVCGQCGALQVFGAEELLCIELGHRAGARSDDQSVGWGWMPPPETISLGRILRAVAPGGRVGFCAACGKKVHGVGPGARDNACESCGAMKAFGAEELLAFELGRRARARRAARRAQLAQCRVA